MNSRIIFLLLLIALQQVLAINSFSQSNYTKHISTSSDEYPEKVKYVDDGTIMLISHRGEISENYYESFLNYSNVIYKLDFDLNVTDSLNINILENYEILIRDVVKSDYNGILVWANALDTATNDIQLCLIWFDYGLNIIDHDIYGQSDLDEVISDFLINQYDQLVFTGSTNIEDYIGDYILWEFDLEGTEISKEIYNQAVPLPPGIIELTDLGKYHISTWFDILQFDYDLNFETEYNFSDSINVIPNTNCKAINGFQYLQTGTYLKPPIPGSPWEMDMAFVLMDQYASVLDVYTFGEESVLDNAGKLDFLTTDTIYFAGTKNLTNNPPEDSWISLYVTNLDGEVISNEEFGESGQNAFRDIFALPNGGYVIAGTVWDFYNFPDTSFQRDIIIVSENYGSPLTGIADNQSTDNIDIVIYPNPGNTQLKISSSLGNLRFQLFDYTGKKVIESVFNNDLQINTSVLSSGLYFYKIQRNSKLLKSGKWLKK